MKIILVIFMGFALIGCATKSSLDAASDGCFVGTCEEGLE